MKRGNHGMRTHERWARRTVIMSSFLLTTTHRDGQEAEYLIVHNSRKLQEDRFRVRPDGDDCSGVNKAYSIDEITSSGIAAPL